MLRRGPAKDTQRRDNGPCDSRAGHSDARIQTGKIGNDHRPDQERHGDGPRHQTQRPASAVDHSGQINEGTIEPHPQPRMASKNAERTAQGPKNFNGGEDTIASSVGSSISISRRRYVNRFPMAVTTPAARRRTVACDLRHVCSPFIRSSTRTPLNGFNAALPGTSSAAAAARSRQDAGARPGSRSRPGSELQ